MSTHARDNSDGYGYGRGGYGRVEYGHPTDDDDDESSIDPEPAPDPYPDPDPHPPMTDGTYRETGEQLDEQLAALGARLEEIETSVGELSADVAELQERPEPEPEPSPGPGGENPELADELAEIRRARRELELVGNPRHTRTVAEGQHEDSGYHPFGAWGLVVTAEEDVHWREAAVHAEESGTTSLDVYLMDYEEGETYDVGDDRLMTRQLALAGGRETVYPDVMLHRGQTYFITRDSRDPTGDGVVPLKRGARNVDWDEYNASDVPLTFECSWQLGRSGPGSQAFRDYRDAGWDSVLHHWRACEFGYNEEG